MRKQADGSWAIPMTFGASKKEEDPIAIGLDEGLVLIYNLDDCWRLCQVVLDGAGNSEEDFPDKSWLPPGTCQQTLCLVASQYSGIL